MKVGKGFAKTICQIQADRSALLQQHVDRCLTDCWALWEGWVGVEGGRGQGGGCVNTTCVKATLEWREMLFAEKSLQRRVNCESARRGAASSSLSASLCCSFSSWLWNPRKISDTIEKVFRMSHISVFTSMLLLCTVA